LIFSSQEKKIILEEMRIEKVMDVQEKRPPRKRLLPIRSKKVFLETVAASNKKKTERTTLVFSLLTMEKVI
jgi:hypothetical protein